MHRMRKALFLATMSAAGALPATGCLAAVEVKLRVREPAGVVRRSEPVTTGVPFAEGLVREVSRLSVRAGGRPVPAQFLPLVRWPDGSVRWALVDCQVDLPAGGALDLVLRDDGANPRPKNRVSVTERPGEVEVSTGPLAFTVDKRRFNLFREVAVDGRPLVTGSGRGLVIWTADGREVAAGPPGEVRVEQAGPLRAVLMLKGAFPGLHQGLLGYTVRITAYGGRRFVKVQVWLENYGAHGYSPREPAPRRKPEWFAFDGMAVELGLGLGPAAEIRAECEGARARGAFLLEQRCNGPAFTFRDFAYRITSGETTLDTGARTDGVVRLEGQRGTLTVACRYFWQNYEKAVELEDGRLRVWLWPRFGQWPRDSGRPTYPGYARKVMEPLRRKGLYNLPGSVRKGHELILDFTGRKQDAVHATLAAPLFALASPEYYAATGALPGLFAPPEVKSGDPDCDRKLAAWNRLALNAADRKGTSSIFFARRGGSNPKCFWYGWMDFGDLSVPQSRGYGPRSLHYDWTYLMLLDYLRMQRRGFLDLALSMARHRIDIDQCWSDREAPGFPALQRPDYGYREFHCSRFTRDRPEPRRNWVTGVVLYYMLTGEPMAYECALRNAKGLEEAWNWMRGSAAYRVRRMRGDLANNLWSIRALCSLYDLTAETRYLEGALRLFRENIVPRWRNLGPHLHSATDQIRAQDYVKDDIKYCYGIEALCELHRRTGDAQVLKLLREGAVRPFPETFYDAPLYLANLYAYVAHLTGDEELLQKAVDAFVEGFPESKSPPCFLPDDTTWSRESAMLMRTGHIFQYVLWKHRGEKGGR